MVNVSFVILMSVLAPWLEFVMSAIMVLIKEDVSFVVGLVCQMPTIARNALFRKRM